MTNEEIKKLADGYYAGMEWLDWKQEQDTKVGWSTGFAYAMRQAKNISSNPLLSADACDHDRHYSEIDGFAYCNKCGTVMP